MAALSAASVPVRLRWHARRLAGRPWARVLLAVISLLLLALAAWHWLEAEQQLDAARSRSRPAAAPAPVAAEPVAGAQLGLFYDQLPPVSDAPYAVQTLFDLAERQGLRLMRGDYRMQPEAGTRLVRYRLSLPVRGEPARVQRFVQAALLGLPTLAVDGMQFKREENGMLEVRIQWVLFMHAAAEPKGRK